MEESDEILVNSLANSGVPIPPSVSSITDLTPDTLFSVCSAVLRLIDPLNTPSFPPSLSEESPADRVKIFTDVATAFKRLGFIGDLSFHKFLYPSEDDLYKLVRFLVGRLSGTPLARLAVLGEKDKLSRVSKEKVDDRGECPQSGKVLRGFADLKLRNQVHESSDIILYNAMAQSSDQLDSTLPAKRKDDIEGEDPRPTEKDDDSQDELQEERQEVLHREMTSESMELQDLEEELELLKEAAGMIFDHQHHIEFYMEQLSSEVETKRSELVELASQSDAIEKPLKERKRNLVESLSALNPEACDKLMNVKEIELETESLFAEIKKREEERSSLSADLWKQPKLAPRRSYIERIKEITKNSKKQDADIQQILNDTRELQLESNSIQERLNRTYAVVDETIFREAKKDPVARQAYRLLTSIHDSFEQIAEKILATDRTKRSIADYEAKLATTMSRSLNVDKLQADLDSIRKENDLLEHRFSNV